MKKILALVLAMLLIMSVASVSMADGEEPVALEFFIHSPYVTDELPDPSIDIYKQWFDTTFGIDMKLINSADGDTELLSRLAADNAPDLICFPDKSTLMKYYNEDVLLDDWNKYADQLPHWLAKMGELQQRYYTVDGKLTGIAAGAGEQYFGWLIRKDWLAALELNMPTNLDELYDVLYAFTYNDPDGNGKDDTYGITAAGGGVNIGELINLVYLVGGRDDWYIAEDGSVSHPALDGTYLKVAEFVKKCYDGGVVDPNWYTQGWEDRKSQLFGGAFGMCWYPPKALYSEQKQAREDEEALNWWAVLPLFDGCAYGATGITGQSVMSVSEECAADEAKMAKVVEIFDTMSPMSEDRHNYDMIVKGIDFDGQLAMTLEDGTIWKYQDPDCTYIMNSSKNGGYVATACYAQCFKCVNCDNVESGSIEGPDDYFYGWKAMDAELGTYPRASAESKYVTVDQTLFDECDMVWNEFALNYILGVNNDYDAFVENWKIAGGDEMMESVTEQFKEWGFLG